MMQNKEKTNKKDKERRKLQKTGKKILLFGIVLFIVLILLFQVFQVQDIMLKKIYPIKYSEYIYQYAKENGLDPLLVCAIIKAESNFDPNVVSSSNAIRINAVNGSNSRRNC